MDNNNRTIKNNNRTIMVVDDEADMLETCSRVIKRMGYNCITYDDSSHALDDICKWQPDLIITDLKMPEYDGFAVLDKARQFAPKALVIIVTGYASVDSAVRAMKEGAYDYLPKPFSIDQLQITINKALQQIVLREENYLLRLQLQEAVHTENIIGVHGGLQSIFATIGKMAKTDASTLILGESGTGKELIARSIHNNSKYASGPFIPVDCASLPENLLESELFGHEKGAFTGAHTAKEGLIELANGGTLFLDEIGELSLPLQAKLLRVLEERAFRRVGGTKLISVNIRVIAATNRDIEKAVACKEFREDLFYRINVITLKIPSLRERGQDIPLLLQHFCHKFAAAIGKDVKGFSPAAVKLLENYHWPGNIRELRNVVERAVSLCDSNVIKPDDLPSNLTQTPNHDLGEISVHLPFHEAKALWLKEFEVKYLEELLAIHNGNITKAAQKAGIDRKTIHRLVKKYNLQ
ncbi:MAG: sigma-54 dependent transcriptional regulator [Bacillota bacterium]